MSEVTTRRRWSGASVALIIVGSLFGLFALGAFGLGGAVAYADHQRDSDGYYNTATHAFVSSSYAITHEGADIDGLPNAVEDELARIRVTATSTNGHPVFVGIARERDAEAYLANVAHSTLRDFEVDPFRPQYDVVPGNAKPAPPAAQHFWAASATGSGAQELTWRVRNGTWVVVAMNADGARGVATDVTFGANVRFLAWVWSGLLLFGAFLAGVASLLIVLGFRNGNPPDGEASAAAPSNPAAAPAAN
jgi:hypothetical protein